MTDYSYPVHIHNLFISSGHNYFGRPKDGPGQHTTRDVDEVYAEADHGLVGDRYFGVAAHFDAQVTFLALEVFTALCAHFARPDWLPILLRRNIVIEGAPLNQLIGQEFEIISASGASVRFQGARECSPCAWMNAMLAPGAQKFLRGRGGLRARILTDGGVEKGAAQLLASVPLDAAAVLAPRVGPNLP